MSKYIGTPVVSLVTDTVDVTGDITTTDATPEVIIVNDTSEDTDGGREGKVTFKGQQSGGEETTLAQIQASHDGTSDDEKGDLIFKTNDGSDGASPTERMRIDSAGLVTITNASNDAQLRLESTDADASTGPQLDLYRNSASPADNDYLGRIKFIGRNDASQDFTGVDFLARSIDVSDSTEDASLFINVMTGGAAYNRLNITPTEVVFNEESRDVDFRIESDVSDNAFFVQGSDGRVSIGIAPSTIGTVNASLQANQAFLINYSDNTTSLQHNCFFDGSNNVALTTGTSSQYYQNGGSHHWRTAASASAGATVSLNEKMKLDSTGKLRVGGDSATISNSLTVEGASYTLFGMKRNTGVTTGTGEFAIHMETNSQVSIPYDDEGSIVFGTAGTPSTAAGFSEKIRINSSGDLAVNNSTASHLANTNGCVLNAGDYGQAYITHASGTSNGIYYLTFALGGSLIGSVSQNTSSSVAFNTTSDYRLKENIVDIDDGITRVKQLQPRRFNFIAEPDLTMDGFIAHEAQTVVPESVTGTKDEMEDVLFEKTPAVLNEEGDIVEDAVMETRTVIKPQGIDQSKIVPLLTAALQEAIAKIETLETKVAALEGE